MSTDATHDDGAVATLIAEPTPVATSVPAAPARSNWIISPLWDCLLLIGTPLAIVPAVMLLAQRHFSVEQISLIVVSFASIGHHLPGFLRAYADRDLWNRFKWRLVLAPPLLLALSWLFTSRNLHGLALVLLVWATWHVLMQTYGFMRIYDLKRGLNRQARARWDFWACMAVFCCGLVFSDARMFGLSEVAWRIGLPSIQPAAMLALRWGVGIVTAAILGIYAVRVVLELRGSGVVWTKTVLLLTTGWLYWFCGTLAVDVLIGVAMFEIFHAIQYDAIVLAYDRKLGQKVGQRLGPLRFMLQNRWCFLGFYVAAIAAFGSMRFFTGSVSSPTVQHVLLAVLSASTLLHFYYDGFIWKISRPVAQSGGSGGISGVDVNNSKWWKSAPSAHAFKWSALALVMGGLLLLEVRGAPVEGEEYGWLSSAARWAPHLADVQARLSREALLAGDLTTALDAAQQAADLQPASDVYQADLGALLARAGRFSEAQVALRAAIGLQPGAWQHHFDLAGALAGAKQWPAAEIEYADADRLEPGDAQIQQAWASADLAQGKSAEGIEHLKNALLLTTSRSSVRAQLVSALSAAGKHDEAIDMAEVGVRFDPTSAPDLRTLGIAQIAASQFDAARQTLGQASVLDPTNADGFYRLGLAELQLHEFGRARQALETALKCDPKQHLAWFQLGNLQYSSGDVRGAIASYRRCTELTPTFPDAFNNLGAALFGQQQWEAAADAYQHALVLQPNNAASHYNLGLLLLNQRQIDAAREHILRAAKLGQAPSPEVAAALGL